MGQFIRQHQGQTRFVRQNIHQSATEHNRVADGERLEWRREQNPTLRLYSQTIADDEVVDHRIQHSVNLTRPGQ